jgi:hypothetical protein
MSDETTQPEYNLEAGPLKTSVEALMERLGMTKEAVAEQATAVAATEESKGEPDAGGSKSEPAAEDAYDASKEDWTKFDLDPNIAHLYPKSVLMETGEGPAYVAQQVQFSTSSHAITKAGAFINEMLNGPEQWQLSALLPNGSGLMVVVLMRSVRVKLPHPVLLETETKVEAPKDEELKKTEDAALNWAGQAPAAQEAAQEAVAALEGEDFGAVEGADVD